MKPENDEIKRLPKHIAIILDGNGRYAKAHGLPRAEGHRRGADNVETIADAMSEEGVPYMTVYAFSTENWKRSKEEVEFLMQLLNWYLDSYVEKSIRNGIRVRIIGDRSGLSEKMQEKIAVAEERTKSQTKLNLTFAINYGGRDEITRAARKLGEDISLGKVKPEEVSQKLLTTYLDTAELPDPDLVIRTSGEERISNFLLWQMAYSELYFSDKYWPEFTPEDLHAAIVEYSKRNRRFGGRNEKGETT